MGAGAFKSMALELTGTNAGLGRMLDDSGNKVDAFVRRTKASNQSLSAGAIAAKGLAVGVAAVAAGLAFAIGKAVEFDKAMRNVNSLSNLNQQQFAAMEKQVISMSTKLPQSATTLAEGLYDIASSGFQGADGIKVLDAAARSASAGLTTTATSARAITGVLNAYGLGAKDAADVSDTLFSTVNLGVISFDELANNLGDVVGSAAAASVGIDQVGSAIATMTLSGVKGAQATTSLNDLMKSLVQPSTAMVGLFKQLGYESGASALKQKGLEGVMDDIRKATGGNITTMLQLFPNIEAARGALALMANDGATYAKVADQITDKTKRMGATQRVLDEQMKSVSAQWQLFQNRIDAAAISVGVKLLPGVLKAMTLMQDWGAAVAAFAVQLKDKMQGGIDDLKGSLGDVLPFLEKIGSAVLSAGKALGGDAIDGAVRTFDQLASSLHMVTQFASQNEQVVMALGLAYAVHATGGVASLYSVLGKAADGLRKFNGAGAAAYDFVAGLFTPGVAGAADSVTMLGDKAKAAGSKLKSFAMMAAPAAAIGATLTVAVIAWQNYSEGAKEAADVTKQTQAAMRSFDVSSLIASIQKANSFVDDTNKKLMAFGNKDHKIDMSTLFDVGDNYKLLGAVNNLDQVQKSAYDAQVALSNLGHNTLEIFRIMGQPMPDAAKWMNDLEGANGVTAQTTALTQMQSVLDKLGPQLKAAGVDLTKGWDTQQMTNAYSALQSIRDGSEQAASAQKSVVTAMAGAAGAMGDASGAADKLKQALDGLMGASLGLDEATVAWGDDLAKLSKTLKDNHGDLRLSTQAGRDNHKAIIAQVKDLQDVLVASANAGAGQKELTTKLVSGRDALLAAGKAAGIPKKAMQELLSQYKLTPELVKTLITQSGAESTADKLAEVKRKADALSKTKPKPLVTLQDLASGRLNAVQNKLDAIDGRHASATVTLTESTYKNMIETTTHRDIGVRVGADGFISSYANGKLPGQAMVMPAQGKNGLVQWAEDSTEGEAFIPLAKNKRSRSEKILDAVAGVFGKVVVDAYASGGFHYPAFKFTPEPYKADRTRTKAQQASDYKSWKWHAGQDRAQAYADWIDNRRQAAEQYKENMRLLATATGRGGEGVLTPGRTASSAVSDLASTKETRAQALAQYQANQSANPHDTAEDFYKKPKIALTEYIGELKKSEAAQRQWGVDMRKVSSAVGADVVSSLRAMGEDGEKLVSQMSRSSVKDMQAMAEQIRKIDFANFTNDTIQDVKGKQQFEANLQTLVKLGRSDLAAHFQQMGYDSAAGLAAQAVKTPTKSLSDLASVVNQQDALNDPNAQKAYDLARLIQSSGGKIGIMGLANASGMSIGDVLGVLQTYGSTVFDKIPLAARKQLLADQALLKAGKQPSGLAMGAIVPGSDTGFYWAEKSSGGESLIPHGMDRRQRALQLWHQTGRILGAGQGYGGGGGVTIEAGAIVVPISVTQADASAADIKAAVHEGTARMMEQLNRYLTSGRRA